MSLKTIATIADRSIRSRQAVAFLTGSSLLLISSSNAATIRVGTAPWGDFATIQEAISAAGDEDELWVQQGIYSLSEQIAVDKDIRIYGGFQGTETARDERDWSEHVTTIDGQRSCRCLMITADARIDGFTIQNGEDAAEYSDGGGIYVESASPAIVNCSITGNVAGWRGGGMFNDDSSPTIDNCTFADNQSGGKGGAINNEGGSAPAISNTAFSGNEALYAGGAIYNGYGSSPTIKACGFSGNRTTNTDMGKADSSGGAIYNDTRSSSLIEDCTFFGNSVNVYGGAIYNNNWMADQPTVIKRCRFLQNTTPFSGGAVFDVHARGEIKNSTFIENEASYGGALSIFNTSDFSVINCVFLRNSGSSGASIDNSDSDIVLMNSILWGPGSHISNEYSSCVISYSDIQGSGGSASWNPSLGTDAGGNIESDPLFRSDTDVHLSIGSPCINAGNPDPAYNDADGTRNDMGAYGGSDGGGSVQPAPPSGLRVRTTTRRE